MFNIQEELHIFQCTLSMYAFESDSVGSGDHAGGEDGTLQAAHT